VDQLKGLPPVLIQVAEFDVLRDEGEAYGRKLDAAGDEAITVRYNGTIQSSNEASDRLAVMPRSDNGGRSR
jgi:acetyl esterase/lipase